MAINHQKTPHGGWKYFESRTNTSIITMNRHDLTKAVTDHRRANGINIGDVEEDIDSQIEKLHPELSI